MFQEFPLNRKCNLAATFLSDHFKQVKRKSLTMIILLVTSEEWPIKLVISNVRSLLSSQLLHIIVLNMAYIYFIKELSEIQDNNLSVTYLPSSSERFISISLKYKAGEYEKENKTCSKYFELHFLDSSRLMQSSLDNLTRNLSAHPHLDEVFLQLMSCLDAKAFSLMST